MNTPLSSNKNADDFRSHEKTENHKNNVIKSQDFVNIIEEKNKY